MRIKRERLIFIKSSLFFLIIFQFYSCISSGEKFSSDLTWIENHKTSQQDVKMVLGTPYSVGSSGGIITWTYAFYQYVFPTKTYFKELRFYWKNNKRVKNYSFNSSFPEDLSRVHIRTNLATDTVQQKNNSRFKDMSK